MKNASAKSGLYWCLEDSRWVESFSKTGPGPAKKPAIWRKPLGSKTILPLLLCMAFAACSSNSTGPTDTGQQSRPVFGRTTPKHGPLELWTNNGAEPEWIDPGLCSESAGSTVIFNIFSGLLQPDPETLEPRPDIATSFSRSDDGLRYEFKLRRSVWSDGHDLVAGDFEWSWKRVLDPKTNSKYASFLWVLLNGEAFFRGAISVSGFAPELSGEVIRDRLAEHLRVRQIEFEKIDISRTPAPESKVLALVFVGGEKDSGHGDDSVTPVVTKELMAALAGKIPGLQDASGGSLTAAVAGPELVGVRAADDYTLVVELDHPVPYFLSVVMFYTAMPVPRHLLERLQAEGLNPELWTRPEYIVSNGAYTLSEWKFRQHMRLQKNPRYWDAANTKLERIKLLMVESHTTTLNLYKAGELDWVGENATIPNEFLEHLSGFADFHKGPYLAMYYYWLNTGAEPLNNPKLRQALSLAIDRDAIVKHITRGGQVPWASVVPDGLSGYKGLGLPIFDPEMARQKLREAGYQSGSEVPPISIKYNTSEGHKQIALAVQQMWREHLGIDIELANQEWKVFLKDVQAYDFQIARMGWIGDYPDPFTFLELLLTHNGNNHSNWGSPEYDAILSAANRLSDPKERMRELRRAERLAMEEMPLIPFFVYTRSDMWKPYVKGVFPNFQNRHPFKDIWIATDSQAGNQKGL